MLGPQRRAVQEDCREAEARAIIRPQCTDTSSRFVPHPVLAWLETMHQIPLHNRREIPLLAMAIDEKNWCDNVVLQSKTPLCGLSLRLFAFSRKAKYEQATAAA